MIEAEEARSLVAAQLRSESQDNVEAIEERLFKLRAVARKYRVPVSELPAVHQRFLDELSKIEMGAENLEAARKGSRGSRRRVHKVADALSDQETCHRRSS